MLILKPPAPKQENYHLPSQRWRDFNSLKATALDAERYPILARNWLGPLTVGGKLACNDSSPLVRRFKTVPVVEVKEPAKRDDWRHVDQVADRVLAVIAAKTADEAV